MNKDWTIIGNDDAVITERSDVTLRKWCLEQAFHTRALNSVPHMEVTNLAEQYYLWITEGKSQSNSLAVPQETTHEG
jgi:hypothetical protein